MSTLAKASSKTTIDEFTSNALPRAVLCLWPPLNVIPLSPTIVLNPFGKLLTSSIKAALIAEFFTNLFDALGSPNLIFSEIVDVKRNAS